MSSQYFTKNAQNGKSKKEQSTNDIRRSNNPAAIYLTILKSLIIGTFIVLGLGTNLYGQPASSHTEGSKDQVLKGTGRINPSTLAMEIEIPLGNYPGRGINVPVSLSYSSKVWRMDYVTTEPFNSGQACYSLNNALFGDRSAAGWTNSLATPYIEYIGWDNMYDDRGFPKGNVECLPAPNPQATNDSFMIKRILVNLPSGETHELRMNDTVYGYDASEPQPPKDGIYYAADSSNLKYIEDSATGTYKLLLPDGSSYEFSGSLVSIGVENAQGTVRKAVKYKDRNGNFTSYNEQNGTWTDTLGRTIAVPFGLQAPTAPTTSENPQVYTLPGMTGSYKFHWKRLKGNSAAESALTDFSRSLKYPGDRYNNNGHIEYRPAEEVLFSSDFDSKIAGGEALFNPVVLTKIELPTGLSYQFTYDIYGRIERIYFPTGGEERFTYERIKGLTVTAPGDISELTNFGVTARQLFEKAGQGVPYQWTYGTEYVPPRGYKLTTNDPEGIKTEKFLHWGIDQQTGAPYGSFGYGQGLAGMPYETRVFDRNGQIVSKSLTHWEKTSYPFNYNFSADWHPRVTHEENYVYDPDTGDSVRSVTRYEYEGDLSVRTTPVLKSKTLQYDFQGQTGGSNSIPPDQNPDPDPTPVPTPVPPNLIRSTETTYLVTDPSIPPATRDIYKNKNMLGLITSSVIKDPAGTIVSKSEAVFDETGRSPAIGRGNPTTARIWDSTKGSPENPQAYIQTGAKFDTYGNQLEMIDAKGNATVMEYDPTYQAFPVRISSPIPGDGTNGSNTAFVNESTYDFVTGLQLTSKDINGQTTVIEYDWTTLRPKKVIPPTGGSIIETIYHDQANVSWIKNRTQIDENKWEENITYFDGLGRPFKTEQIDAEGNILVEKEFDSAGRESRVTNPYRTGEEKFWTTNVYDDAGRLRDMILPDGGRVKTDYGVLISDLVGTTKQITDQAGRKRTGVIDSSGRMIRVIEDPDGENLQTNYVFDTMGNLRETIQGEQHRFFMFDSLQRLSFAKQPEQEANPQFTATDPITGNNQWSIRYRYDDAGNVIETTDARGVTVTGIYDRHNRVIKRDYSDSTPDVTFFYDGTGLSSVPAFAKGQTTKISSSVSETRNTSFDHLGRLLAHEQVTGGRTYQTAYVYNLSGVLIEETYPSGRKVLNTFDENGDLSAVSGIKPNQTTPKNYMNQISYNANGSIERMRLGNGRWESAVYNSREQIVQIGLGYSAGNSGLLKIDYDYGGLTENNGSLKSQKITHSGLSAPIVQNYTYDSLNRLRRSTETVSSQTVWQQSFSYDRFGNRRFDATNTTTLSSSAPAKVTNPQINTSDNRLKKDQDGDNVNDYDFDKTGNVILDAENKRFIHDAENRLKEFFNGANQTSTPDAIYEYDGVGQRVRKVSAGIETIFVYNAGGTLVAEYSNETSQNPKISYLTADHLGSPRVITDGGGAVVSRHDYLAFGDEVSEVLGNVGGRTAAQGYGRADDIRQQYTGYQHDVESGLEYAQARYYKAAHGRFTSVDPLTESASIRNPQTFNRYAYVLNNPYQFIDPLGLLASTTSACGNFCLNTGDFVDGSAFSGTESGISQAFANMAATRLQTQNHTYYIRRDGTITQETNSGTHNLYYVETENGSNEYQLVAELRSNSSFLVEFPASGTGFSRYGTVDKGGKNKGVKHGTGDHFVKPEVAAALFGMIAVLKDKGITISFGDMSADNGTDPWTPNTTDHTGHGHNGRSGLDIDFRYINNSGNSFQGSMENSQFSKSNNQLVYDTAKKFGFTENYRGSSVKLTGVKSQKEHNDHGHLGFSLKPTNIVQSKPGEIKWKIVK